MFHERATFGLAEPWVCRREGNPPPLDSEQNSDYFLKLWGKRSQCVKWPGKKLTNVFSVLYTLIFYPSKGLP